MANEPVFTPVDPSLEGTGFDIFAEGDGTRAGDRYPARRNGVDTGFAVFSGPGQGNVPDSTGAFSPFFARVDDHPSFTASTDAIRSTLGQLARRARRGDAAAAAAYDDGVSALDTRRRLYDRGYSAGLNDRNASRLMDIALSSVAGMPDGYADRLVDYYAKEAIQRGFDVDGIRTQQLGLDEAFKGGYNDSVAARRSTSGLDSAGMRIACLGMKSALQEWEAANGLRSDETRAGILRSAADYLVLARSTPGLSGFVSNPRAIIDAAAKSVGAVAGTGADRSALDRFSDADSILRNGFVSFYDGPDADMAAGVGRRDDADGRRVPGMGTAAQGSPAPMNAINNVLRNLAARNAQTGKDNLWETDDALHGELVAALSAISPQAAAHGRDSANMFDDAAREIIRMKDEGHVDLSRLAFLYNVERPGTTDVSRFIPNPTPHSDKFRTVADDVVNELIAGRAAIRYRLNGELEPQYTREGIGAVVDARIGELLRSPDLAGFAEKNPDLVRGIAQTMKDFVYTANNVADPRFANGDVADYKTSLQDRVNALFIADAVSRFCGVDLKGWIPDSTAAGASGGHSYDQYMRGNSPRNVSAIYGGLASAVDSAVKDMGVVDADAIQDDETYARYSFLVNVQKGLETMLRSGYNDSWFWTSPREVVAKSARAQALYELGMADGTFNLANMPGFKSAMAARAATARSRATAVRPGTDGKAAALRQLVDGLFLDVRNPQIADRAAKYVRKRLTEVAPGLNEAQAKVHGDRLTKLVVEALRKTTSGVPPAVWQDDDALFDSVDRYTKPALMRAKAASDLSEAIRQRQLGDSALTRGRAANKVKEERDSM